MKLDGHSSMETLSERPRDPVLRQHLRTRKPFRGTQWEIVNEHQYDSHGTGQRKPASSNLIKVTAAGVLRELRVITYN